MDVGDQFTLSGAIAVDAITAVQLNITHIVTVVLDDRTFEVETAGTAINGKVSGGGSNMVITYIQMETVGYIYSTFSSSKIKTWARFKGWNWRAGCVSQLGRVFFAKDRKFYLYGAREDPVAGDRFNEFDAIWDISTAYAVGFRAHDAIFGRTYRCTKAHTSRVSGTFENERKGITGLWEDYEGDEITAVWELPWADFNKRMLSKDTKFIGFDTVGTAEFTVKMFVDGLYKDEDGTLTPLLDANFFGGSVRGFGGKQTPYGGARLSNDERPWPWPATCKIAKLRFEMFTSKSLRFVSISLAYLEGSIYR